MAQTHRCHIYMYNSWPLSCKWPDMSNTMVCSIYNMTCHTGYNKYDFMWQYAYIVTSAWQSTLFLDKKMSFIWQKSPFDYILSQHRGIQTPEDPSVQLHRGNIRLSSFYSFSSIKCYLLGTLLLTQRKVMFFCLCLSHSLVHILIILSSEKGEIFNCKCICW